MVRSAEMGVLRAGRSGGTLDRHSQLDPIVWRMYQILPCTEISLGRLDGLMTEQQLDLLQFAPCGATQHCTGTAAMPHENAFTALGWRSETSDAA